MLVAMVTDSNCSIDFFDKQFEAQVARGDLALNPFEQIALGHLRGRVLDHGCGLGNLSLAAARAGHEVFAVDASRAAVTHLRDAALRERLPLAAQQVDLRSHRLAASYDTIVSIGLLMFFDCDTARSVLRDLQAHVAPGGVAVINVLIQGTTYLDMFDPRGFCLFDRGELADWFEPWEILHDEVSEFAAPNGQSKRFATIVARKPQ
jgi:tellurite methyltransferase